MTSVDWCQTASPIDQIITIRGTSTRLSSYAVTTANVLLIIIGLCQTASLYDDDNLELNNQFRSLTRQQLAELDEFLSHQLDDDAGTSGEVLDRNTRRPQEHSLVKRDALWTTTEVLDCVRRLKLYRKGSTLDLTTEMLNCYRRLRHSG